MHSNLKFRIADKAQFFELLLVLQEQGHDARHMRQNADVSGFIYIEESGLIAFDGAEDAAFFLEQKNREVDTAAFINGTVKYIGTNFDSLDYQIDYVKTLLCIRKTGSAFGKEDDVKSLEAVLRTLQGCL